jgi:thioredoxin reductase (NADPH)
MEINVIIIGSGPSGLSAGLYLARAALEPLLLEGTTDYGLYPGGQLEKCSEIENYLGIDSINGLDLTDRFREHAIKYGLKILPRTAISISPWLYSKEGKEKQGYKIVADDNSVYLCRSVVIATGANAKTLKIPGEERFYHYGISACATCDGSLPLFRNKLIAVVGGGDTAAEEALYLSKFASSILLIHRGERLRASKIMIKRLNENPKIQIRYNTVVTEALGSGKFLESIKVVSYLEEDKKEEEIKLSGLFYGIGHIPNTSFLTSLKGLELDDEHYIKVRNNIFTSLDGVFACGDVCDRVYRQAITSAGTGCMAALEVERYLT